MIGAPSIWRRRIGKSSLTRFQSTDVSGPVMALPALRSRPERLVALGLELLGELDAAARDDPAVDEDVDVVRLDLVALLLAAGEALVQVAVAEGRIDPEPLHPLHRGYAQLEHRQVDALARGQRLAEELDDRDSGDLLRVLKREEHPCFGPLDGGPVGHIVAAEGDR